jgi:hypothetical protein
MQQHGPYNRAETIRNATEVEPSGRGVIDAAGRGAMLRVLAALDAELPSLRGFAFGYCETLAEDIRALAA